jgi:hypothetical protein
MNDSDFYTCSELRSAERRPMTTNAEHTDPEAEYAKDDTERPSQHPTSPASAKKRRKSLSMHEGIAVWCDCCSCEAEPYWVEIAEAMGMDLGSDYEDQDQ